MLTQAYKYSCLDKLWKLRQLGRHADPENLHEYQDPKLHEVVYLCL